MVAGKCVGARQVRACDGVVANSPRMGLAATLGRLALYVGPPKGMPEREHPWVKSRQCMALCHGRANPPESPTNVAARCLPLLEHNYDLVVNCSAPNALPDASHELFILDLVEHKKDIGLSRLTPLYPN